MDNDAISEMTEKLYHSAIGNCSYKILQLWPHEVSHVLES